MHFRIYQAFCSKYLLTAREQKQYQEVPGLKIQISELNINNKVSLLTSPLTLRNDRQGR